MNAEQVKGKFKRIGFVATIMLTPILTGCAGCERTLKSFHSNINNGLHRTVTVYDYNGNKIKSWTGKFDVTNSENEVYFDDENDKRIIIHGGIVINEEK